MSFWRRLFGGASAKTKSGEISPRVAEILAEFEGMRQSCLWVMPGEEGGRSRLGGIPDMSAAWPRFRGDPLSCVAQLDLGDICAAGGPDWLPRQGRLLFFYGLEYNAWGATSGDAGSSVVIYETEPSGEAIEPEDLPQDQRFPAYPVTFILKESFPREDRLEIDWKGLNKASSRALERGLDAYERNCPTHQIGGYPSPVQGDVMEEECAELVGGEAAEWRLLLQIDSDDEVRMMWGDSGTIYFWVREEDARASNFSKIWMTLQCC